MFCRRIFAGSLVLAAALLAGACAKRADAPESNAPPPAPAEQAPAGYGQPGLQAAPTAAEPPGGAGAGLVPPKSADEKSAGFATLADAEQALAQAQGELDGLTPAGQKKGKDKASSTTSPPAGAAPTKPDANATPLSQGDPRCERACKAFASMRRAADGVCRLAGDSDARCARARGIVKDNETRVSACKCDAGG